MKNIATTLSRPACKASIIMARLGGLLCTLCAAAVFLYAYFGVSDTAAWLRLHWHESIAVILLSIDITLGAVLAFDYDSKKNEEENK